jgi:hypothetical protein
MIVKESVYLIQNPDDSSSHHKSQAKQHDDMFTYLTLVLLLTTNSGFCWESISSLTEIPAKEKPQY